MVKVPELYGEMVERSIFLFHSQYLQIQNNQSGSMVLVCNIGVKVRVKLKTNIYISNNVQFYVLLYNVEACQIT